MIGTTPTQRPDPSDNRAVSDVLAFVLVFSIIITSVGLVYVFGMGALEEAQVSEQNRNAERAFETMGVSFSDLQTGRGEERLSQLNPRGGRVSITESPTVEVTDDSGGILLSGDANSLEYAHEGTTISYELGAVFRADDGHSVMIRPPEFVCSEGPDGDHAVVSYPTMSASQPSSVSTSSTLRVRATRSSTDVERTGQDVTIAIEGSTHADAWKRYFEKGDWDIDSGETDLDNGEVVAECAVTDATIRKTELEIELLS